MKPLYLRAAGLLLALVGLGLMLAGMRKTVRLVVDGQPQQVRTFAANTGALLKEAGIIPRPEDRVWPAEDAYLRDGSQVIVEQASRVVVAAGERIPLVSAERRPANLLAAAGVRLFPGDRLLVDGSPHPAGQELKPGDEHLIQVLQAQEIVLDVEGEVQHITSAQATLGAALAEAGIVLQQADQLEPSPETPLLGLLKATLRRSRHVEIKAGKQHTRLRTAAHTVGEALAEAGLAAQGLDYSLPALNQPLPADGKIQLVRVREAAVVEQEPLEFETKTELTDELELDTRKVIEPGEYGLLARRVRVRYENGEEVSRAVEAEWVAKKPKARVMGYGTKIVVRTLQTPDGPIEYWRVVPMYATSYSPCRIYKDHCDDYTALGYKLQKGVVAMTNAWCRYTCGDRVYVPGYGAGVVADTGGGVPGRYWIDLGYSESDYVSWHQMVNVYFLTPVPANYQVVLP